LQDQTQLSFIEGESMTEAKEYILRLDCALLKKQIRAVLGGDMPEEVRENE